MSATALLIAWAAGLFAFGALVIAIYGGRNPAGARELWRVYASTLGIAAVFLLPAAVHPALFSVVVAAGAWRCAFELAATWGARIGVAGHCALAAGSAAAVWWGAAHDLSVATALILASAAIVLLTAGIYAQAFVRSPSGSRAGLLCSAFPLLAAAHLSRIAHLTDGFIWVFVLYATVETQDSMAYLFGRVLGRRRMLPRLSPNKTVEGGIAGAACALGVGAAMAWGLLAESPARALGITALVVTAGFCGDLFTSALKRAAGVKDFPRVHRLHGGVLDIYDSTLFASIPLSFAIWAIQPI